MKLEPVCCVCEKPFTVSRQKTKKYCSSSCKNKSNYSNHKEAYAKSQANRYRAQSTEERIYYGSRNRARREGTEFTISLKDIVFPDKCPITNEKMVHSNRIHFKTSPSLDRIDNTKGYIPGNVRVISYKANSRKGDLTLEEIKKLYQYSIGEI